MGSDQKFQPGSSVDTDKAQEHVNGKNSSSVRPSLRAKSSLESTKTTLPRYSEQSDRPPTYSSTAIYSGQSNTAREPLRTAKPSSASMPTGPNAAAVRAVMATSSSSTDKMHSQRSKKVDDWNKDPTYKGKLASMSGSIGKWNYLGVNIEQYGNPFKRSGKKK